MTFRRVFFLLLFIFVSACSSVPDAKQQEDTFRTLLTTAYGAFEQDSESAIYDTLASAVDGDLLQTLYNQFSESLSIEAAEGKRAEVQTLRILQVTAKEREAEAFKVKAIWEVEGVIAHEDHRHEQLIQYEGLFKVAKLQSTWKIVGGAILKQRRTAGSWEELAP